MITSRLDNCNATFAGVADEQIARIQKIQNNAAWLILKKSKRDHVTPLLKEFHWLPVKYRIQYKLATLAFLHFDGTLPPYLSSSLCTYQPSRSLRSSTEATYVRCMRVAVTCHLHIWQNDRDLLRTTAVTRGWNGYQNKSQHRKSTLEKKILPLLLQGFEPSTFQSQVWHSNH